MKKFITFALATLVSISAMAQQADLRKKITVTGNSEIEVTPDIIYVNISLKEYLENNNSKRKIDITRLENQLYTAVQKAGIPKENLTVNNLASYNYATEKKKNPDFLASKQYRLKVSDLNKFNAIIGAIDPKGISNTNIDGYDYSKLKELRREMKIKALMDAKEKATYMVEALGSKLGSAIDIQDLGNDNINQPVFRNYAMAKAEMADAASAPELDFKKIKLSYNINVVFEIR
ncbi:SIMPL domain-containing protein [Pedobacter yulinensis]|uniref:SIMPL domain-containing protein n=1 Tax=Pedobacter yulinensis TaxID=2126353 RepID=A0A2T3HPZ0_9SPHI|nr:SIMPL domain-containing protein [Pedobacter yulinensis]PST84518.1 SIMPL domain-containing protein [Pedobacter yulinensis]